MSLIAARRTSTLAEAIVDARSTSVSLCFMPGHVRSCPSPTGRRPANVCTRVVRTRVDPTFVSGSEMELVQNTNPLVVNKNVSRVYFWFTTCTQRRLNVVDTSRSHVEHWSLFVTVCRIIHLSRGVVVRWYQNHCIALLETTTNSPAGNVYQLKYWTD